MSVAVEPSASSPAPPCALARHPLFDGLEAAALGPLLEEVRVRRCEVGEMVCRPGARPALHLLLSGRLCLYELTTDGRRIILDYLEAGGVDGLLEVAGMDGHFSVATEAAEVASIAPPILDRISECEPAFGFNLLTVAMRRLRRREEQLERLALRDPDQRIADQLLALARQSGNDAATARWWAPRLSHEALADMLALRRETVTLHLGRLRRRGAIRVEHHRFLLDRPRLEALRDGQPLRVHSASPLG